MCKFGYKGSIPSHFGRDFIYSHAKYENTINKINRKGMLSTLKIALHSVWSSCDSVEFALLFNGNRFKTIVQIFFCHKQKSLIFMCDFTHAQFMFPWYNFRSVRYLERRNCIAIRLKMTTVCNKLISICFYCSLLWISMKWHSESKIPNCKCKSSCL